MRICITHTHAHKKQKTKILRWEEFHKQYNYNVYKTYENHLYLKKIIIFLSRAYIMNRYFKYYYIGFLLKYFKMTYYISFPTSSSYYYY